MKGILTILKKELRKFFTDRRMLVSLILPGLLIYLVYSLMGNIMTSTNTTDKDYVYQVNVVDMPSEYENLVNTDQYNINILDIELDEAKLKLENKEIDLIISFDSFNSNKALSILYNSTSNESFEIYNYYYSIFMADSTKIEYDYYVNLDPNTVYDLASEEDSSAKMVQMLVPFLLIILLFSGCMAISVESIAGEKERGTIATLLVTPVRRMDIAIGKAMALSITALFSASISFIGVILSFPKLMGTDALTLSMYGFTHYIQILAVIIVTVLLFTIILTMISCYARTIKEASGLAMPLMVVTMIIGITSMLGGGANTNLALYLIPVYNSVLSLSNVFGLTFNIAGFAITIVSNLVYFGVCVFGLTKMFNSERVMFNS